MTTDTPHTIDSERPVPSQGDERASGDRYCVWNDKGLSVWVGADFARRSPLNLILTIRRGNREVVRYFGDRWSLCERATSFIIEECRKAGWSCQEIAIIAVESQACLREACEIKPFCLFPDGATPRVAPESILVGKKEIARGPLPKPAGVSSATWNALRKRDGRNCLACEIYLDRAVGASVHHLVPRTEGGTNELDNLVLLCPSCHDKLEVAQEAGLAVTGRPPTRTQITGIFVKHGEPAKPPILIRPIAQERKQYHAYRIYGQGRRSARTLLQAKQSLSHHVRADYWRHVDWALLRILLAGG